MKNVSHSDKHLQAASGPASLLYTSMSQPLQVPLGNKKHGWKSCLHKDVEERTRLHSSVTCFTLSMVRFQEGQSEPVVTMFMLVTHNN